MLMDVALFFSGIVFCFVTAPVFIARVMAERAKQSQTAELTSRGSNLSS
ncbi:hypothetical protein ACP4OV_016769 [Aristida adscensionis]